jgi:hypothetical protein
MLDSCEVPKYLKNTALGRAYQTHELNANMTEEDHMLGGPCKLLTLRQFAYVNGYSLKTGDKL